ncbi:MAG: MFS transporter [Dermabacter sp.]|nr:MFS transporter [Dermabacter sp.]
MSQSSTPSSSPAQPQGNALALALATIGFGINFWAWALLSPLATSFVERGVVQDTALLVATPVLVGSLGRIPIGALTDRFGGRLMFPLISLLTVIPVLFIGFLGLNSYPMLLLGAFFLGISGTTFAIGVPYVNSWYPKEKRGGALGIYGLGTGGTAIAAFTTVHLTQSISPQAPFVAVAIALTIYAIVGYALMRNSPAWAPSQGSLFSGAAAAAKLKVTWQAAYLYALSFGGYVAFSVYLPVYLVNAYDLDKADAALRMGGFVIVAVLARPIGGMLSDRFGAVQMTILTASATTAMALVLALMPTLTHVGTVAFLVMGAALGAGSGAVFALIGKVTEPKMVGAVTGFVGASGGLGGFVPPLILGALWNAQGSYSLGLVLLAVFSGIAVAVAVWVGRDAARAA